MKAKLVLEIDMGEVSGENIETLEHRVVEVMKHLPLKTANSFNFDIEGHIPTFEMNVQFQEEEVNEQDMFDNLEVTAIRGDDAALQRVAGGMHDEYETEAELFAHLAELEEEFN